MAKCKLLSRRKLTAASGPSHARMEFLGLSSLSVRNGVRLLRRPCRNRHAQLHARSKSQASAKPATATAGALANDVGARVLDRCQKGGRSSQDDQTNATIRRIIECSGSIFQRLRLVNLRCDGVGNQLQYVTKLVVKPCRTDRSIIARYEHTCEAFREYRGRKESAHLVPKKGMSQEEVDNLMHEVERFAEAHDVAALRKYPFICIGETCNRKADVVPFGAAQSRE